MMRMIRIWRRALFALALAPAFAPRRRNARSPSACRPRSPRWIRTTTTFRPTTACCCTSSSRSSSATTNQKLVPGLADVVEGARRPHLGIQAAQERAASTTARPSPPRTWSSRCKRVPNVPNSPSSFATFTKPIVDVKVVDPAHHRLQDRDAARAAAERPGLGAHRARRLHGEKATTEDYNSGKAAIGTGPYKFAEYIPNQRVVLKANYGYWGGEEPWDKVTFKILTNSGRARRRPALRRRADDRDGAHRGHREARQGPEVQRSPTRCPTA